MLKTILFIPLIHLTVFSFAQINIVPFEITPPAKTVQNSIYKNVQFIDTRENIADLGYLLNKGENNNYTILPKYALEQQIINLFDSLTNKSIGKDTLAIQLRRLTFTEAISEYCFIRIQLYRKNDSGYQKLALLDTTIEINHGTIFGGKIEKRLFKACNTTLTDFVSRNLIIHPSSIKYLNLKEVENIESIEKNMLPLYTTEKYMDGLYYSFESFSRQQTSDVNFTVKMKNEKIKRIEKESDVTIYLEPSDIYALVYKGKPYIATEFGYYPLIKIKNDFFFTGKERLDGKGFGFGYASAGRLVGNAFGVAGGVIGLGIGGIFSLAQGSPKATFDIKIDYLKGEHIQLKKID